jgi:phosphoglycerate dehydrogenase-like enzyme
MSAKPLRILVSQKTLDAVGPGIGKVLGSRPFTLLASETAGDAPDADIAFVTRDVIGASARNRTEASTQRFFDQMSNSPRLQWLQVNAAGADRQVFLELRDRGVIVTSAAGANANVVAQTALAGFLALARRFPQLMAAQREHKWKALYVSGLPRDLQGQVALVVGWGAIGRELGAMLKAVGLEVIVVRNQAIPAGEGFETAPFEILHAALSRADWVFLACQLTEKTRGLMNASAFAAMQRGAHLVNVARGEVVNEDDLVAALRSGQVGGAFLDVFAHEPLDPASPFWDLENVIVTPHSAGQSDGIQARVAAIFLENLSLWIDARPLRNRVP